MNKELITARNNNSIYKSDDSIIKVFRKDYLKQDVFNEALITSNVENLLPNVPSILEVVSIDGCWAFKLESFSGKCLADIMTEDSENVDKYLDLFVKIQTDIHSKRCESIPTLRAQLRERIALSNLDDDKKFDLFAVLDSSPKHKKLCHGNLNPTHIWVDGDKFYILDWNHATQGNASADVAKSYLWFSIYMPEYADKYMDIFCEKTNTTKRYVRQWLPIVAAARLIKGVEEETPILNEWISKCDYQ